MEINIKQITTFIHCCALACVISFQTPIQMQAFFSKGSDSMGTCNESMTQGKKGGEQKHLLVTQTKIITINEWSKINNFNKSKHDLLFVRMSGVFLQSLAEM